MIEYFKELYQYRQLLAAFVKREIKVRYKQTVLGAAWAIIQPLSLTLVFTLIFANFLKIDSEGIPYPLFSYSALMLWTFFTTSLTFGALSIINNSTLITKVYFPRETLPLAQLGAAFLDFAVSAAIFILMLFFYKVPLTANVIYVVPILAILVLFTAAVTLFATTLMVIWRDVKFVIPLLVQLWIFATPVIYPASRVPESIRLIYTLDPITPVISSFRAVSIMGQPPNFVELAGASLISVVLFLISYSFFKTKEKIFADII